MSRTMTPHEALNHALTPAGNGIWTGDVGQMNAVVYDQRDQYLVCLRSDLTFQMLGTNLPLRTHHKTAREALTRLRNVAWDCDTTLLDEALSALVTP